MDFDEFGFPGFEPYIEKVNGKEARVTVQTNGNRNADISEADRKMGIDETYRQLNKLTWHHVEDMRTMILIKSDIHSEVKHTGGIAVYKNDINFDE